MERDVKMSVIIRTKNEKEQERVANSIHHQLVGNEDYINSNILLSMGSDNDVKIFIFEECENLPNIII